YKFIKDKFHELSAKAEKVVTPERRRSQDEERAYCLLTDLSGLPNPEKRPGLKAVGRVVTTVRKGETVQIQTRYYISSITDTERFAYAVRKHWSIENQLH
ncbi:MAG: ISAs1 family transposase, partial [Oscillospiraceae bacterium]|nr:ISAs1 family transposase [Oscillospiraceae bacterium]